MIDAKEHKIHHFLEQTQQIASKDGVALGTGGGMTAYTILSDAATIAEQIGMICGGILSVLVLGNWLYVHFVKKKKEKK